MNIIIGIIKENILEREPQEKLFAKLLDFLQNSPKEIEVFLQNYIKLEIELLQILGYGMDLSECAATGRVDNLFFVSPKSGRAVCFEAGEKYSDKLLKLPQFLTANQIVQINKNDLLEGLKLSGFFIDKYLQQKKKSHIGNSRSQIFSLIKNQKFLT